MCGSCRPTSASRPSTPLKLNPLLGLDPLLAEGVAHQLHLGDQIRPLQQGRRGSAAGKGHVGQRRTQGQAFEHLLDRQIAQLEGHVDFVEHTSLRLASAR